MALVESTDLPLGTPIYPFELKDPNGILYKSKDLFGPKGLLIVFTCNHCPYALAVWSRLIRLAAWSKPLGVHTVGINPNIHPDYPEDAPAKMKEKISEWAIPFPYLIDETQEIAKAYKAQCTPDPYLFDSNGKLTYHGRIDDNWQDETKVKKQELKEAISKMISNQPLIEKQYPALGCSIKWR